MMDAKAASNENGPVRGRSVLTLGACTAPAS